MFWFWTFSEEKMLHALNNNHSTESMCIVHIALRNRSNFIIDIKWLPEWIDVKKVAADIVWAINKPLSLIEIVCDLFQFHRSQSGMRLGRSMNFKFNCIEWLGDSQQVRSTEFVIHFHRFLSYCNMFISGGSTVPCLLLQKTKLRFKIINPHNYCYCGKMEKIAVN